MIYFLEAVGLGKVKIGFATDVRTRVRDLKVGCPVPVSLLGCIAGSMQDEQQLHKQFSAYRSHGEWFFLAGEVQDFIRKSIGSDAPQLIGRRVGAWLFQDRKQLAKLGDDAPWCVGWYDPDGKRKGKTIGTRDAAEQHALELSKQLTEFRVVA